MQRLAFTFILLLCVVVLGGGVLLSAQDSPPDESRPFLQLIDTAPLAGEELGLSAPVTLYFDRALDCESASAASITPAGSDITCEANTLIFTGEWQRDTDYTVRVESGLTAQDGATLADAVTLNLSTTGYLVVSTVIPAEASVEVDTRAPVTVVFNRPVVPLGVAADQPNLPQPFVITPNIEGTTEWVNTSIVTFTPSAQWDGGSKYTVTIDPSLIALDGAPMRNPYAFSFITEMPVLVSATPESNVSSEGLTARGYPLTQDFSFTFNQSIDRASFENGFRLSIAGVAPVALDGTFTWNDDSTQVTYKHGSRFELNTPYTFEWNADTVFERSGTTAIPRFTREFQTISLPDLAYTDPGNGSTVNPYGGFSLYFRSPMNPETLAEHIVITPQPENVTYFYRSWNDSYAVNFAPEANTTYVIDLLPGMEDVYGNRIEIAYRFSYTTRNYPPEINLIVPQDAFGFYDSARTPTELYATHLNVSQLNLSLTRHDPLDVARLLQSSDSFNLLYGEIDLPGTVVRTWTIPSVAPENRFRYERITPAQGGVGSSTTGVPVVECPGAIATRAKVGDRGIVIAEPDPLRARAEPQTGEIVDLLYKDYAFPIIGGPECRAGILWWQIALREGEEVWVAEGIGDEYFFDITHSAQVSEIPLNAEVFTENGGLPPGIYTLTVSSPETRAAGNRDKKQWMVVGSASVNLKTGIDSAVAWVTDVHSGEPLAFAPVKFYYGTEGTVDTFTDAQGIAQVDIPRRESLYDPITALVNDVTSFGIGFSAWSDGIDPWRFNLSNNFYPSPYTSYVYSDRSVYRPGQTVYFRGVIRATQDLNYTVPDFNTVNYNIKREGVVIDEGTLTLTRYGTFSTEFTLADDANVGFHQIEISYPHGLADRDERAWLSFDVAQYRLPEFQVRGTTLTPEITQGDLLRVEFESTYFFGGALADANVDYTVFWYDQPFNYTGTGRYSFVAHNESQWYYNTFYGEFFTQGVGVTTADGKFIAEVEPTLQRESTTAQRFSVEASVRDSSGQTVSGRADAVVHPAQVYIGVGFEGYVSEVNRETNVELISVGWDSQPIGGQSINVEVARRVWSSVQKLDPVSGELTYTSEVEIIPLTDGRVVTDANGRARFTFVPDTGGVYVVTARSQDNDGNPAVSADTLWVTSREFVAWQVDNNQRIELIVDKPEYAIGDTAEVLITSPFTGTAEAWVTVERSGVLFSDRVTLDSNSAVYRLPITEDFAPNVFVSVFVVKGVGEGQPVADFRMGMTRLRVDSSRKVLNIDITTDAERATPGDTLIYTITTTDYTGAPVQAEVGVGLTDLASLSIGTPNAGSILEMFYGLRMLSVRTSSPLTINTDLLTQYTQDVIKGGGGGGGGGDGIFEIRQEFLDTPLWLGALETNVDGVAEFEVTLPDNLTTWRMDVRGLTLGDDGVMLVGQNTQDIVSTLAVLVRPVTPRFFVINDQAVIGVVVNNNTDEDLMVEVDIQSSGLAFEVDQTAQVVNVPANGNTRVNWNVTAQDVDAVEVIFFANADNGRFTDAARPVIGVGDDRLLPVYRYIVPETVGTSGVLSTATSRTEGVVLPARFDGSDGELVVTLQTTLAGALIDGLDYLKNHRCQCTTLIINQVMANSATRRALRELSVSDAELTSSLDREVNIGIQRLAARQNVDGGWGWYMGIRSDTLVSSMGVLALISAREAGYAVDGDMLASGVSYIRNNIDPSLRVPTTADLNRQAFMLYVLAKAGVPDIARMSNLLEAENLNRLDSYAKALLLMALPESDTARRQLLRNNLLGTVILSANGAHWEETTRDIYNWNTDTRTTTMILRALLTVDPQNDLLPNVVRWLMVARTADAWETIEETAWAVWALSDWMIVTGELDANYGYSVTLNDATLTEGRATPQNPTQIETVSVPISDLQSGTLNRLVLSRGVGEGRLYYSEYLRVFLPVAEIEPLSRGVTIQRQYINRATGQPVTRASIGEIVDVRLTIIAPNDLQYLIVNDPFPAGTEGINPNLQTSAGQGTEPGLVSNSNLNNSNWGWWLFDNIDFLDDRVVLSASYLPRGTYQYVYSVRPSIEGTFNVIPPTASELYFPEVYGRGAGSLFTVLPAD